MRPRPLSNPPNPWATTAVEYLEGTPETRVHVFEDRSQSILSENDSPDVPFRWSVNPYRGCQHACAYCYARPTHEYLGFGAGTDFDTQIVVKKDAPTLLKAAFDRGSWRGEVVVFSGVTDCYQPLEAHYKLTRACLEVCAAYKNPVGIITKAPLIERDLDVLGELARVARLRVSVSVPFWDADVARKIEPWVATPERRLRTIETLARAGISVGVNVAPVIPGLNDKDIQAILTAARSAGATRAGMVLVRLPGHVKEVFAERIQAAFPLRADKILHRIRDTRGGKLYDSTFGSRQEGEGEYASTIQTIFDQTCRRLGYESDMDAPSFEPEASPFTRPGPPAAPERQLSLF